MIVQKLKKQINTNEELAEKYYSILSVVNGMGLTHREIQLIAFTAIKGNITTKGAREEFCKTHSTSSPTINNIISKLKKIKIFVKDGKDITINPLIVLDFSKSIGIQIVLEHEG